MCKTKRTDAELREAAKHLRYEIEMLGYTAFNLTTCTMEQMLQNALIESFGIHSRVLIDFLYSDRKYPDDIVAEDYIPADCIWEDKRGNIPQYLCDVRKKVDKLLAHLTAMRLMDTAIEKEWSINKIAAKIGTVLLAFAEIASPDLVGTGLGKYVVDNLPSFADIEEDGATTASASDLPTRPIHDCDELSFDQDSEGEND